jgi:hypothetical protein
MNKQEINFPSFNPGYDSLPLNSSDFYEISYCSPSLNASKMKHECINKLKPVFIMGV